MITRENYEEFFLLYIDNELSAAARSAVTTFVDEHPDLREEWEAFLQCRVEPEAGPVFLYKNDLLKEERSYYHEDMLLSYVDGELDAKDRASVDDLIGRDPSKALELRRLLLTVGQPDLSVVFPDKEILYRTEHRRRLVPLLWMRAGVAAALLGAGALLFLIRPHGNGSVAALPIAVTAKKYAGPVTPQGTTPLHTEKSQLSNSGTAQQAKLDPLRTGSVPAPEKRSVKPQLRDVVVRTAPLRDRTITPLISSTDTGRIVAIVPTITPDKKDALPVANAVAVAIPKDQSSFATQALLKESGDGEADHIIADETDASAPAGKTKLRKIFRRVSRAFGKTADRDDDGQRQVLISAFQVALK